MEQRRYIYEDDRVVNLPNIGLILAFKPNMMYPPYVATW